jgi:2-polyprenyl-3-methyl-5-hydroxy-6-metoxy-1,4-benzoquinol methylase
MSQPFDVYARYYDLMYMGKDYKAEAEYIAGLIRRYAAEKQRPLRVLDLACGTGKHAFELSALGFEMQGSDISGNMIGVARESAKVRGASIQFHNESFQTCDRLQGPFDIVISMFSAIDYVTTHADLIRTMSNVHGLLADDGLFIFDHWNAAAVTASYSPVRVLRKNDARGELVRVSETTLDPIEQIATIHYTCLYLAGGEKVEFEEIHRMRYHTFTEMELLLRTQGFDILNRCPFLEPDRQVRVDDWNIGIVARKVRKG